MSGRELLRQLWDEWAPSWSGRRFDVGGLVVTTRKEESRLARECFDLGVLRERESPGVRLFRDDRPATARQASVRHLRSV